MEKKGTLIGFDEGEKGQEDLCGRGTQEGTS